MSIKFYSLNLKPLIHFWELNIDGDDIYYVSYAESKFLWAIDKKTRIYFQTIFIAICCT
jgi:hypothetical protein